MNNRKTNKGITLIALIITIIVMLILAAVTINMAINGGLFGHAKKAKKETKNAINAEQELANGRIQVAGVWYDSIQDYVDGNPSANQGETGNTPIEQTYTWEKYSFKVIYEVPNYGDITWLGGGYRGSMRDLYEENINNDTIIERYSDFSIVNNNSFTVSGMWTGNYKDYLAGQYSNYPYGILDKYSHNYSTLNCSTGCYDQCASVNNVRGLLRFLDYSNKYGCGCNQTHVNYSIYPEGFNFQYEKGSTYLGTVTDKVADKYPTNYFKDGYWYVFSRRRNG